MDREEVCGVEIRKPYPTGASDEGWAFVARYPPPMDEADPQRRRPLGVKEREG